MWEGTGGARGVPAKVVSVPPWTGERGPTGRTITIIETVPFLVTFDIVRPYTRTHSKPGQSSQSLPFEWSGWSLVGLTSVYVEGTGTGRDGTNIV